MEDVQPRFSSQTANFTRIEHLSGYLGIWSLHPIQHQSSKVGTLSYIAMKFEEEEEEEEEVQSDENNIVEEDNLVPPVQGEVQDDKK